MVFEPKHRKEVSQIHHQVRCNLWWESYSQIFNPKSNIWRRKKEEEIENFLWRFFYWLKRYQLFNEFKSECRLASIICSGKQAMTSSDTHLKIGPTGIAGGSQTFYAPWTAKSQKKIPWNPKVLLGTPGVPLNSF